VVDGARVPRDALGLERVPHPLPYRPLPGPRVRLRRRGPGGGLHPGPRRGVQAEPLGLEGGRVERGRGRRGGGAPGRGRHGSRGAARGGAQRQWRRGGEDERHRWLACAHARHSRAREGSH